MIIISVYEYYSGRNLLYFFLIAGSVFIVGALFQILFSKSVFKRLESMDAAEETVRAQLLSLRRMPALNIFNRKYRAVFLDADSIEREFSIPWIESQTLEINTWGELLFKQNTFVSFTPDQQPQTNTEEM